ncbi:MAG TPA: type I glyceraldehyde-3-phosphate dehydrogenase [bacterium]|nr:type I glyceraldehyde-3-phosphate dehydrogenase [bacterium]
MAVKVGINGFGRIGRNFLRSCLGNKNIEVVAINDLTSAETLAHLLKYDSTFGTLDAKVSSEESKGAGKPGKLIVNKKEIAIYACKDPKEIPWNKHGIKIVVESTGIFRSQETASYHLSQRSVKKVIISAPAKGTVDFTVVMGVNDGQYDPKKHNIISNASCTTNCLAPVAKVLNDKFGIVSGLMCTIHSYTNDQKILDLPHSDLRRARAAGLSIIPTTTGAAKAVGLVLPELNGKLTGYALRVPTPTVSVVDLAVVTEKAATPEAINREMLRASRGSLKGILEYVEKPLVSMDFKGSHFSSSFDPAFTQQIGDNHVKVMSWYDNEMGYSNRMVDLAIMVSKSL